MRLYTTDGKFVRAYKTKPWTSTGGFGRCTEPIDIVINGQKIQAVFDASYGMWVHFYFDGASRKVSIHGPINGRLPGEVTIDDLAPNAYETVMLFTQNPTEVKQ